MRERRGNTISAHDRDRGEGGILDEEALSGSEEIQGPRLGDKVLVEEDGAITLGCAAEEEVVHVEVLQHFLGVEQDAQDFENLVRRHHQVVIADI